MKKDNYAVRVMTRQELDMIVAFEAARMYKGYVPDLPLERIFGVKTFELG